MYFQLLKRHARRFAFFSVVMLRGHYSFKSVVHFSGHFLHFYGFCSHLKVKNFSFSMYKRRC